MGYKFGVWLVYKQDIFSTKHIGHFTITCFMEKNDAFLLYNFIAEKYGKIYYINIKPKSIIFDKGLYKDDDNNLEAWGYIGDNFHWDLFKELSYNYICNFSYYPHTTIQYSKNLQELQPKSLDDEIWVDCTLEVVDITNDDPTKWSIITNQTT